MNRTAKVFLLVYASVLLLDIAFILLPREGLRWFTKPLLMPLLMLAFSALVSKRNGKRFFHILAALFFSWCGDVLLQAKNLFIPGLLSFLLAHVSYILYFRQVSNGGYGMLQHRPILVLPVLLYLGFLLWYLFPYLGQLRNPVIVYSLAIGAMLLMALHTKFVISNAASHLFISGALLFVISDSLLAVQLFVAKGFMLGPLVMTTYALAQYLIVRGASIPLKRRPGYLMEG